MSSYTELPQSAPPYSEGESGSPPRQFGDNIPDDFKYSVSVASCELPLRQLFIRKVYLLLTIQLMGSVIMGFIIRSSDLFKIWTMTNTWLLILSFIGSIGYDWCIFQSSFISNQFNFIGWIHYL